MNEEEEYGTMSEKIETVTVEERILRLRSRVRERVTRFRQRLARALWTSDGRIPAGAGDARYRVEVVYPSGAVVRMTGECSEQRVARLTGFLTIYETPYYQVCAAWGAVVDIDTSQGALVAAEGPKRTIGVLSHSTARFRDTP